MYLWKTSIIDIENYAKMHARIPLRAYVVFYPVIHILDIIFLLLSITGVILEFTLLRSATTTDEVSIATYIRRDMLKLLILYICSYVYLGCLNNYISIY